MGTVRTRTRSTRAALQAIVGAALVTSLLVPAGASATPGTPGVPGPPTSAFTENFENGLTTTPVLLDAYTGPAPQSETYTASAFWLNEADCNGVIISGASADQPTCLGSSNTSIKSLANSLGILNGTSPSGANHAVAEFTRSVSSMTVDQVEFATVASLTLPASNRFIGFSVNVAALGCGFAGGGGDPKLKFYLIDPSDPGNPIPTFTTPIDPCGGHTVNVAGSFPSNSAKLYSGTTIGIQMTNGTSASNGNDHAIDDVKVLDSTPQLDQSFAPATISGAGVSTLTFTITNTSDLAEKDGWSFQSNLPSGVVIAATPDFTTTCTGGTLVSGSAGTGSLKVKGDLDFAQNSCTATIKVTAQAVGTYTNTPGGMTPLGLDLPNAASLTVNPPETTIDTGPTPITPDPTPAFTFSSDVSGSTFTCQIDSELAVVCNSGSFTPGSSLSVGPHTFSVFASDPGGNPDLTPATRTFAVDPPDTTIDSGPAGPTDDTTPTFAFSSSQPASATFKCRIDGGPLAACDSGSFTPGSPLGAGPHSFEVFTINQFGLADATAATRSFSVTAPVIVPDTAFDTVIVKKPTTTSGRKTIIRFRGIDSGGIVSGSTFRCRFDTPKADGALEPCTKPVVYRKLAAGKYHFEVLATAPDGRADETPAVADFKVGSRH